MTGWAKQGCRRMALVDTHSAALVGDELTLLKRKQLCVHQSQSLFGSARKTDSLCPQQHNSTMTQSQMAQLPDLSFGPNRGSQVGLNLGTIKNEFNLPPGKPISIASRAALTSSERPETPPQPFASIPLCHDPDFIDRGDLLDQIGQKCSKPPYRVALIGLGGVGKSQLGIHARYGRKWAAGSLTGTRDDAIGRASPTPASFSQGAVPVFRQLPAVRPKWVAGTKCR